MICAEERCSKPACAMLELEIDDTGRLLFYALCKGCMKKAILIKEIKHIDLSKKKS